MGEVLSTEAVGLGSLAKLPLEVRELVYAAMLDNEHSCRTLFILQFSTPEYFGSPKLLSISQTINEEILPVAIRRATVYLHHDSMIRDDFVRFLEGLPQNKGFANLRHLVSPNGNYPNMLSASLAVAKRCPGLNTLELKLHELAEKQNLRLLPADDGSLFAMIKSSGVSDCKVLKLVIVDASGGVFRIGDHNKSVSFGILQRWLIKGFAELGMHVGVQIKFR